MVNHSYEPVQKTCSSCEIFVYLNAYICHEIAASDIRSIIYAAAQAKLTLTFNILAFNCGYK